MYHWSISVKKPTQEELALWFEFNTNSLMPFIESLSDEHFVSDVNPTAYEIELNMAMAHAGGIKEATKLLRELIVEEKVQAIQTRWRSFKYRKKNKKTTLQVSQASRKKMLDFVEDAEASGIDEAIDMLLTKKSYDFDLEYAKEKHGERLYDDEGSYLNNLLNILTKRDRERIISEIKLAFLAGWSAAKRSRTKKPGANEIAAESYVGNMKNEDN
ncbi:MAG: hypothetical protein CBB95_17360 [Alteromonas sp. TMED35]|jgi:hypothetical protein|nr:MAG: hypothetical protein CBB95_17360 [Alteromonas sp. TMED35]|tara:strand:- start:8154 stop:8798 length:645 start_codon:yes stop_codon:yes gene_type:complete